MTDLQLGLIALGGGVVVSVLAYNKWQEIRHRKVAEQVLRRDHDDVLLGGQNSARTAEMPASARREPGLESEQEAGQELGQEAGFQVSDGGAERTPGFSADLPEMPAKSASVVWERTEPVHSSAPPAPLEEPPSFEELDALSEVPAGEVPLSLLDPRIDFIVALDLVELVPAPQIMQAQREALLRLKKPVVWVGFNERQREWEVMQPDSRRGYRRLRIGLQLADRRGPLAEADFTLFVAAMQQLADELMAVADMSPSAATLNQALEIDRFCAEVDLEIGVHLVSKSAPFAGTKIRALAEAAGMTLGADGLFTRYDDEGRALFSLQNYESSQLSVETIKNLTTHGLTFLLDVPRVNHGERVFFQMLDLARRFADALQGLLVDDNRQPLSEPQLDHIKREYVLKPQAGMASYGIAAGSPQALRLFS